MTDKIVRADNTVVTGIKSCTFKEQVNTSENLRFGACAASSIEFEVYASQANAIPVGEVLTYYQTDANNVDTKIGVFTAQTSIPSKNTYKVIAYDNLTLLETDFSEHLATIQSNFPMTLSALLTEVASVSGVTFANSPASAAITIEEFSADGVSCRQVVSWAAEISGQFVRCDEDGHVEFAWYASTPSYSVRPTGGSGGGVTYVAYKQDGLSYKNAACETVDRVAIKPPEEEDVAYIYPTTTGNTYVVSDNLLLTNADSATMNTIAQRLYTAISAISYRPATINIFREGNPYRAGDIVSVTDAQGVTFNTLVMSMTVSLGGVVLESTGRENYDSDSGSGVHQQLVNLANNIVRINNLKVGWAEIDTAIINYLTANDVTAQNLTIVDAADNVIAAFNGNGITFYNNGSAVAQYNGAGVILGETTGTHAEIDFNSFELYDKDGNLYCVFGDERDENGIADVTLYYTGDGSTTQYNLIPKANLSYSLTAKVNGSVVTPSSVDASHCVFSTAPGDGISIVITYKTTDPFYHYELGNRLTGTTIGTYSVANGEGATASSPYSTVGGGYQNTASGNYSTVSGGRVNSASNFHAFVGGGYQNIASGVNSVAAGGRLSTASGPYSSVLGGNSNSATGGLSAVLGGYSNTASGNDASVIGGTQNTASGPRSVASGASTNATADSSASFGLGTIANHMGQFVFGRYNTADSAANPDGTYYGQYVEIVGKGSSNSSRSNARTLDWFGNETLAGKLYINGGADEVAAMPTVSYVNGSAVNVATGTATTVQTITLSAGVWALECDAQFASNATGYRNIHLATTSGGGAMDRHSIVQVPAVNGATTRLTFTTFFSLSASTTYYLVAEQNSGSTLSVTPGYKYMKFS